MAQSVEVQQVRRFYRMLDEIGRGIELDREAIKACIESYPSWPRAGSVLTCPVPCSMRDQYLPFRFEAGMMGDPRFLDEPVFILRFSDYSGVWTVGVAAASSSGRRLFFLNEDVLLDTDSKRVLKPPQSRLLMPLNAPPLLYKKVLFLVRTFPMLSERGESARHVLLQMLVGN